MKLEITLQAGTRTRECRLDLPPTVGKAEGGKLEIELDGARREIDWALVAPGVYSILVGGQSYEARVTGIPGDTGCDGSGWAVNVGTRHYQVEVRDPRRRRVGGPAATHEGPQEILAPMPGKIVKILVQENQEVSQGEGLLVIEAMKMQNELRAPRSGRVERIYIEESTGVESGCKLVKLV